MKLISANKKIKYAKHFLLLIILVFNIALTNFCQAQNTIQNTAEISSVTVPDQEKTISEFKSEFKKQNNENSNMAKVFSNLAALILIMLVLAWLYNKYGKNILSKAMATKNANKNSINIISTMPIGQNKYLHIVETGGERLLIGVTNNNISLIKNLKKDTELEKAVSDE